MIYIWGIYIDKKSRTEKIKINFYIKWVKK